MQWIRVKIVSVPYLFVENQSIMVASMNFVLFWLGRILFEMWWLATLVMTMKILPRSCSCMRITWVCFLEIISPYANFMFVYRRSLFSQCFHEVSDLHVLLYAFVSTCTVCNVIWSLLVGHSVFWSCFVLWKAGSAAYRDSKGISQMISDGLDIPVSKAGSEQKRLLFSKSVEAHGQTSQI